MSQSLAFLISLAVLLLMPFIGVAALLTYGQLDGWHLLMIFPVEMLAAQFVRIGHVLFITIGSLRTAATVYFILVSKRWWLAALMAFGIHVLIAVIAHGCIYDGGH